MGAYNRRKIVQMHAKEIELTWIESFYIKVGHAKMPIDEKDKNQIRTKAL